jgi:alpha-beta hydrolase superfamily lysophospholipase
MGIVSEVLKGEGHSWHVYVTGHSLGGALATLCSYELANRRLALFTPLKKALQAEQGSEFNRSAARSQRPAAMSSPIAFTP